MSVEDAARAVDLPTIVLRFAFMVVSAQMRLVLAALDQENADPLRPAWRKRHRLPQRHQANVELP